MSFLPQPISLSALIFGKKRSIGSIDNFITLVEETTDVLTITKQPIQDGASITDHAFKEPTVFNMKVQSQPTGLSAFEGADGLEDIYQQFLDLQENRVPFDIQTPKRFYENMLLHSVGVVTDKQTENVLSLALSFQEVILVSIQTATVPKTAQGLPQVTQKAKKTGRKSFLSTLFGGTFSSTISGIGGG